MRTRSGEVACTTIQSSRHGNIKCSVPVSFPTKTDTLLHLSLSFAPHPLSDPCRMDAAKRRLHVKYEADLLATGGVPASEAAHGIKFTEEEIAKEMRIQCVLDMREKIK